MVWYSHLSQNFPQSIVIHAVKGLGIVNKAEIDLALQKFKSFMPFLAQGYCFYFRSSKEVGHGKSNRAPKKTSISALLTIQRL